MGLGVVGLKLGEGVVGDNVGLEVVGLKLGLRVGSMVGCAVDLAPIFRLLPASGIFLADLLLFAAGGFPDLPGVGDKVGDKVGLKVGDEVLCKWSG